MPLNKDTLTVVCGYSGDAHQIKAFLPYYLHHNTPVLVLSPVDAPITPQQVATHRVLFATGGKKAYVGQLSLDRQLEHLKILQKRQREDCKIFLFSSLFYCLKFQISLDDSCSC